MAKFAYEYETGLGAKFLFEYDLEMSTRIRERIVGMVNRIARELELVEERKDELAKHVIEKVICLFPVHTTSRASCEHEVAGWADYLTELIAGVEALCLDLQLAADEFCVERGW